MNLKDAMGIGRGYRIVSGRVDSEIRFLSIYLFVAQVIAFG
jgi:hypothetical protein